MNFIAGTVDHVSALADTDAEGRINIQNNSAATITVQIIATGWVLS